MKLIKSLIARRKEKQLEQERLINLLVDGSSMRFYYFLLEREELSDDDIRYLLKEHKQRVRPCIADIVKAGKPMPTQAVLKKAMALAIA